MDAFMLSCTRYPTKNTVVVSDNQWQAVAPTMSAELAVCLSTRNNRVQYIGAGRSPDFDSRIIGRRKNLVPLRTKYKMHAIALRSSNFAVDGRNCLPADRSSQDVLPDVTAERLTRKPNSSNYYFGLYGAEHSKCNRVMTLDFKGLNTLASTIAVVHLADLLHFEFVLYKLFYLHVYFKIGKLTP